MNRLGLFLSATTISLLATETTVYDKAEAELDKVATESINISKRNDSKKLDIDQEVQQVEELKKSEESELSDTQSSVLTNISFEADEDGDIAPKFFYPIYWTENLFSGVGYSSLSSQESGVVSGFNDSKMSSSVNQQNIKVNFLSGKYIGERLSASLGLSGEYIEIDKTQFGFIHDSGNQFGEGNRWVAFDNSVEIDVLKYGVYFEFMAYPTDWLFFRVSGDVTPTADIDLYQETRFKPLVAETGKYDGTSTQDISYSALGEVMVKTPYHFSI